MESGEQRVWKIKENVIIKVIGTIFESFVIT